MTPLDTIRNVIGHEVAHYVDFKMDLFKIGVDETIRKFNSSVEENGDGGHNNQFEHIGKTIGVDDRFSLASYFPNGQERIIHSAKLFLINCGMFSVLCDEEYSQYHKQKHKNS